ncbi:MAG: hypothetical protein LAP85_26615 [Acidobacteriia bacterium]|nr:hypothetical protein [Terriglobia bacterium]
MVTIFSDDNKKYLSTDLLRSEQVKAGFLAPDVRLSGVQAFKRLCQTCCNPDECMDACAPDFENEMALPSCPRRQTHPITV